MSSQNMTPSHFPIYFWAHSNHLQITPFRCLWIGIHVGLMFIIFLIVDVTLHHDIHERARIHVGAKNTDISFSLLHFSFDCK